jgi:hypothetical protein
LSAPVSEVSTQADEADEGSRSARRRKAKREQEEAEREQLFHLELDKPSPRNAGQHAVIAATAGAELHGSGTDQGEDVNAGQGVVHTSNIDDTSRMTVGTSKSEPSTPIRVTHSDDVLDANDAEKEKRRKRKLKSRRRRLASLGRARSRKNRVGKVKGNDDSTDVFEPEPEDDEREKRIVRLDLDLNLAWRKEDRSGDSNNKGVKYLQRFLFKKRRRHSDGYLDIIKDDELASPRSRVGDDAGEPSVTHRRFFVEEDEGEERENTFGTYFSSLPHFILFHHRLPLSF